MKKILFLAIIASVLVSSCTTQKVYLKRGANLGKPQYEKSQAFFIYGLVGNPNAINTQDVCKGRTPVAVETQITFLDGFLGSITAGIYTPVTVRVYCE